MSNDLNVNVTESLETISSSEVNSVKTVKCKPGQGKLNKSISDAQSFILSKGHSNNRFKRNYENGTALYTCKYCGHTAVVRVNPPNGEPNITGSALTEQCTIGV